MQHNDLTVIGLIASLQSCFIPRCLGHTEWGVFYFFSEVRSMGGCMRQLANSMGQSACFFFRQLVDEKRK